MDFSFFSSSHKKNWCHQSRIRPGANNSYFTLGKILKIPSPHLQLHAPRRVPNTSRRSVQLASIGVHGAAGAGAPAETHIQPATRTLGRKSNNILNPRADRICITGNSIVISSKQWHTVTISILPQTCTQGQSSGTTIDCAVGSDARSRKATPIAPKASGFPSSFRDNRNSNEPAQLDFIYPTAGGTGQWTMHLYLLAHLYKVEPDLEKDGLRQILIKSTITNPFSRAANYWTQ